MHLGQIRFENKVTAAVFDGGMARPVPGYTLVQLIRKAETESIPLPELASDMAVRHQEPAVPAIPIHPPEVWGCGCTFESSATFRDSRFEGDRAIYSDLLSRERPQIFLKGTARICVGPEEPIGIRFDSKFTAPEPELAVVLGRGGNIVGYTLGNDVSARDLERENPLYLPQSKIYKGSCALGPWIVTSDELPEPAKLEMSCVITRDGTERFSGRVSLEPLEKRLAVLIAYLLRANPVPAGTVLLTGTGIMVDESAALDPGDMISIEMREIGRLSNPAARVE
jgi:2-dehydro-3-deoxy-D-arabinonate dehydratase